MSTTYFSTLDGLLADPLVQAAMRADRVDPALLRADLTEVAARLGRPRPTLSLEGARVRFGTEPRAAFVGPLPLSARAAREPCLCC